MHHFFVENTKLLTESVGHEFEFRKRGPMVRLQRAFLHHSSQYNTNPRPLSAHPRRALNFHTSFGQCTRVLRRLKVELTAFSPTESPTVQTSVLARMDSRGGADVSPVVPNHKSDHHTHWLVPVAVRMYKLGAL
eukprot:4371124-Amphidinium_carterae.3